MHRREFLEVVAGAGLAATAAEVTAPAAETATPWPSTANYPNNRAPLLPTRYVKLPLGASTPLGWLRDQLIVQKHGLTTHLPRVWDVAGESGWKGDRGKNVLPECCTPRFVPRWLEGV